MAHVEAFGYDYTHHLYLASVLQSGGPEFEYPSYLLFLHIYRTQRCFIQTMFVQSTDEPLMLWFAAIYNECRWPGFVSVEYPRALFDTAAKRGLKGLCMYIISHPDLFAKPSPQATSTFLTSLTQISREVVRLISIDRTGIDSKTNVVLETREIVQSTGTCMRVSENFITGVNSSAAALFNNLEPTFTNNILYTITQVSISRQQLRPAPWSQHLRKLECVPVGHRLTEAL